jgi:hypothetical protein
MQSVLTVVTPAQDVSLVSLYEAKLGLNLMTSTDATLDDQLELLIEWASAEIASLCNRVFAKETVIESFDEVSSYSSRLYLSRWPIVGPITEITEDGVPLVLDTDYDLDRENGILRRIDAPWVAPLTISYTGGYDLPNDAPRALRQAAVLMTREAYYATTRGDASIRMVAHKDSRVIYFDPNAKGGGASASGSSAARRAVGDLLQRFMRFYV